MTSSSCKGTTPPAQVPPGAAFAPSAMGPRTLGTLPTGTLPGPASGAPLLAPSAAAISCSNFCGSLSHCLNSGPRVWAAIWAAMLTSPVAGSAATNLTSLIRMEAVLASPKVFLISLTTSWARDPPRAKARTSWRNSSFVIWLEKWMLARPAVVNSCAKLRSACPVSNGVPSRRSLFSETPSRKEPSGPLGRPSCNSFQVVANCPSVRLWSRP